MNSLNNLKMRPKILTRKSVRMKDKSIKDYKQLSKDSIDLFNKVEKLGGKYFGDMLFRDHTITRDYLGDKTIQIEEFDCFSYNWFDFRVERFPDGVCGYYDQEKHQLCIDSTYKKDENTILHEMIHLHEAVLNGLPVYRDFALISLYWYLHSEIPDLDTIIRLFSGKHMIGDVSEFGGDHSLLFLLKSFDLDLKKRQSVGTVFGYGLSDWVPCGFHMGSKDRKS